MTAAEVVARVEVFGSERAGELLRALGGWYRAHRARAGEAYPSQESRRALERAEAALAEACRTFLGRPETAAPPPGALPVRGGRAKP